MTHVERDPEFRARLEAAYLAGNLGAADPTIFFVERDPAARLTSRRNCLGVLFALELWAAFFGYPHPALAHLQPDMFLWPRWRVAANSAQAVRALFWLSQSPFGAEFAADTHALRPRLFALAQKHALPPYAAA